MTQILILMVLMFSWNQILGVKVRLLFYWTCLCLPSWPSMLWDNMIAVCERLPLWLVLLHLLLRLSNWRKLVCYQRAASQNWRSADTIVNTCSLHFSDCSQHGGDLAGWVGTLANVASTQLSVWLSITVSLLHHHETFHESTSVTSSCSSLHTCLSLPVDTSSFLLFFVSTACLSVPVHGVSPAVSSLHKEKRQGISILIPFNFILHLSS